MKTPETKLPQQGVVAKKTTTVKRKTNRYVPSEREKIWVFKVCNFRCLNSDHMSRILLIRHWAIYTLKILPYSLEHEYDCSKGALTPHCGVCSYVLVVKLSPWDDIWCERATNINAYVQILTTPGNGKMIDFHDSRSFYDVLILSNSKGCWFVNLNRRQLLESIPIERRPQ